MSQKETLSPGWLHDPSGLHQCRKMAFLEGFKLWSREHLSQQVADIGPINAEKTDSPALGRLDHDASNFLPVMPGPGLTHRGRTEPLGREHSYFPAEDGEQHNP